MAMTTKQKRSKGPAGMTEQELKDVKPKKSIRDALKEFSPSIIESIKKAKENLDTEKMPTTVQEAKEQVWKMGSTMMMSDPPVFTFTKDGKTIKIRGDMPDYLKNIQRPFKKGGMVKGYKAGGQVKKNKSPNSGMITKRGWGASRKT